MIITLLAVTPITCLRAIGIHVNRMLTSGHEDVYVRLELKDQSSGAASIDSLGDSPHVSS